MRSSTALLLAAAAYAAWRSRPGSRIDGSVALVTGGSRGLGYLIAKELLDQGCRVAICGRDPGRLNAARMRLRADDRLFARPCDVADPQAVASLVRETQAAFGPIDLLVNNAAVIQVAPLETLTDEDFRRVLEIDFWGVYNTTRAVLPSMRERGSGRIVNIVSIGGRVAVPHLLPYDVAKFAVAGFSEGLRAELSGTGVNVLTVVPGLMRTGSPIGVGVKGDHEAEFAWFTAGDVLPLTSMDAGRAARRIVRAVRRGESHLTLTWQARLLEIAHALAPSTVTGALALTERLLPAAPADGSGHAMRRGRDIFDALPTQWLRRRLVELGERTNQPVEGLSP